MDNQNKTPIMLFIGICVVLVCGCLFFGCMGGAFLLQGRYRASEPVLMGFNFRGRTAELMGGDATAGSHIFIHMYPMPADGVLTEINYKHDCELTGFEQREEIFVLVLRPVGGGYQVLFRQEILADDITSTCEGEGKFVFAEPLPVMRGDVLAHWQPDGQDGGPIPINTDCYAVDGRTIGQAGFSFVDTNPGSFISADGFTGQRDYFMNAEFIPSESKSR